MRRWVVSLVLGAIVLASIVGALQVPSEKAASTVGAEARGGVLSLRRMPQLLADLIAASRLSESLDRVLQDPDLGRGRDESCLVVSSDGGVLYERNPTRQLTPASTVKLLTAAVALEKVPKDGFDTRVAKVGGGTEEAVDLVLIGGGDPLLATADYARSFPDQPRLFTDLVALAEKIASTGLRRVTGSVVADDSRYDAERYLPSWKPGYRVSGNMGALGALALNDGFVSWRPGPFAVAPDPAVHAAAALTELLRARGVTVAGEPRRGPAPRNPTVVAQADSLPLSQIVGEMLVHSDNETAELLTKRLGEGRTVSGVAAIRAELTAMGYDVSGLAASDGSGLDTGDRATCSLLHAVLTGPSRDELLGAGLAVAGETGTLFDRFRNNPAAGRLKAKTGALEGVVGLAGVVEPKLTFAFLANGLPAPSDPRGKRIQERLGAALAAYPDALPADSLKP
jgi:D-alanyl-D-alanine carboxypeptidase/D-alanyl-D-alanine-endopeptidase (penicillin-binding protein 4)